MTAELVLLSGLFSLSAVLLLEASPPDAATAAAADEGDDADAAAAARMKGFRMALLARLLLDWLPLLVPLFPGAAFDEDGLAVEEEWVVVVVAAAVAVAVVVEAGRASASIKTTSKIE